MATDIQIARKVVSVNPATGEVLREFGCAGEAEVQAAVLRAREAQPAWRALGIRRRSEVLRNFQRLLQENKTEVARVITTEAGKPYAEAISTEVLVVLDAVRFLMENAFTILRDQPLPHGNLAMKLKSGRIVREPYGVIAVIAPWNYPLSTPAVETIGALAAGNAVVLKPSEFTSLTCLELGKLLYEAGVPRDVLQIMTGDGATGAALTNAAVDKIIFTGSVATGKRIAQAAAARLVPVVLELGGKDAMLVLDDADVDVASSGAVWGAFMNAGQTCLSVERCYVHRSIYPAFVEACAAKTKRLRVGNGLEAETDVGPMIHERQLRIVEAHVEEARAQGARILTGGARMTELGANFYAPTVVADVTPAMRIMREETFGPVLPMMAVANEEEAVALANDSEYGLSASVWTRSQSRGEALARRLNAGTVMVNDTISCFGISEAPHGGVKASGIGRTHGRFGLEEMVWIKYVDEDRMPRMKKVWWYGYGKGFARGMEGFVDLQFAPGWGRKLKGAVKSLGVVGRKGRM